MLFEKNIEPRCAYCKKGARLDEERVMCIKKGIVAAGGASVEDSVITGTMNYFVAGVEVA